MASLDHLHIPRFSPKDKATYDLLARAFGTLQCLMESVQPKIFENANTIKRGQVTLNKKTDSEISKEFDKIAGAIRQVRVALEEAKLTSILNRWRPPGRESFTRQLLVMGKDATAEWVKELA